MSSAHFVSQQSEKNKCYCIVQTHGHSSCSVAQQYFILVPSRTIIAMQVKTVSQRP